MTDRARVPFALVGVLLLVSSATLAASLGGREPTEPAVDRVMDGATAETGTALREAVVTAAHGAASDPVLERAHTEFGGALGPNRVFRDALALRIYVRARQNLAELSRERAGLTVSASLRPIENRSDAERAIARTTVQRAGDDGGRLYVELENVTVEASRGSRIVGQRTISPSITVDVPVLAVHDRVDEFEERLDAGPLSPGLGQRLSARLYPIVWARGYAQYRGGPIENVLANRHVTLMANGAILDMQRRWFGQSDPLGRQVLATETEETALKDLLAPTGSNALTHLETLRGLTGTDRPVEESLAKFEPGADTTGPDDTVTVGVNRTADTAFLDVDRNLTSIVRASYAGAYTRRTAVDQVGHVTERSGTPQAGWTKINESTQTTYVAGDRSGGRVSAGPGRHLVDQFDRTVERVWIRTRWWNTSSGPTSTRTITSTTYHVTITVEGDHVRGPAPAGPVERAHRPGGPFGGPNLQGKSKEAVQDLVHDRGGADDLAKKAVREGVPTAKTVLTGDVPDELEEWVYRDLATLRERVRTVSITTTRGKIASFQSNVPGKLADRLETRREAFVDAPQDYANLAQRARVGARAAYVDAVLAKLRHRASQQETGREKVDEAVEDTDADPTTLIEGSFDARSRSAGAGPAGGMGLSVDAAPAYLPTASLDGSVVTAVEADEFHALTVRNRNSFGVPLGGAAKYLFGLLSTPDRTNLGMAARTLASRTPAEGDSETLRLRMAVEGANAYLRSEAQRLLRSFDLGNPGDRREVVEDALQRWSTVAGTASAFANGSAAAAIHERALAEWPERLRGTRTGDRLGITLEVELENALDHSDARPRADPVTDALGNNVSSGLVERAVDDLPRRLIEKAAAKAGAKAAEYARARVKASFPAGLPIVPAPGYWYATVNLWHVDVKGEYARFVVRAPRGSPDSSDAALEYVREDEPVSLDVDGDGDAERLGWSEPVSFDTEVAVVIAVPPGTRGVGDVSGKRTERSEGWPVPGPDD